MPSLGVSSLDLGRTGLPPAHFSAHQVNFIAPQHAISSCFAYLSPFHSFFACRGCMADRSRRLHFAASHTRFSIAGRQPRCHSVPSLGVSSLDLGRRQCRRPFFLPFAISATPALKCATRATKARCTSRDAYSAAIRCGRSPSQNASRPDTSCISCSRSGAKPSVNVRLDSSVNRLRLISNCNAWTPRAGAP